MIRISSPGLTIVNYDSSGTSSFARFQRHGQLKDLEDAISTFRHAVDIASDDDTEKPNRLQNLSACLVTRFRRLGQLSGIDHAISAAREAVSLTPHGHPGKPHRLNNLGNCYRARFDHLGEAINIEQAISTYSHAASAPLGPVNTRFRASRNWISSALLVHHHSLLHAYSVAISLLPQLAWIGLPLTNRYDALAKADDVVREAAAAAVNAGYVETTVEWLEQGRSIVLGGLFELRSSYEELSSLHPGHACKFREVSLALVGASTTRERSLPKHAQDLAPHAARATDRRRSLAIERDKLLQDIRRLPGFKQFLLRKEISRLRTSAHSGPVAILNAAKTRCDALIVLAKLDHVIHVPLPNFTLERSNDIQIMLKSFVHHARDGRSKPLDGIDWEFILSSLWTSIVKPVLDALAISTPGDLSRIFWCPTGPLTFIPIHAAGLYGIEHSQLSHKAFDFVISSYIPTLSVLSPSSTAVPAHPRGDLHLLTVRQPPSDGLGQLPGVALELERTKEVIRNSPSACTTILGPAGGTVEEVLELMKEADWVHFACHGIQDGVDSGFYPASGRHLELCDMIALSRPHGGLAFLSASQTGTGEKHLSDEAINIAAAMLFAGFGGVINSMWSTSDRLAPDVVRDVYAHLFRKGTRPDYREAARALHEATGRLRDRDVAFSDWIPFIHVGL